MVVIGEVFDLVDQLSGAMAKTVFRAFADRLVEPRRLIQLGILTNWVARGRPHYRLPLT
jgi:hypothetical protein